MPKAFWLLFFGVWAFMMAAVAIALYTAPKARCAYCFTGQCINHSICGNNCVCVKRGLEPMGYCASFN